MRKIEKAVALTAVYSIESTWYHIIIKDNVKHRYKLQWIFYDKSDTYHDICAFVENLEKVETKTLTTT